MTDNVQHLDHPALLYGSLDGFVDALAPYVSEGIAQDEVVFVAARGDYLAPLRAEVGGDANEAIWADTFEWHPHPARRLRAFHEFVLDRLDEGARRIRLAGEPVWPDGPPEMVREWQRYESVLNSVLAPFPVSLVCLYDASSLDSDLLRGAEVTHRSVMRDAAPRSSDHFEEPELFLRRWNSPRRNPVPWAIGLLVKDAAAGRRFLEARALEAGLDEERAMELCLAANEILTNAFVHAPGATMHAWPDGDRFICQIDDEGDGIDDPLTGYRPPSGHGESGRGVWIARQLVDLLEIASDKSGTSVRLHMHKTG